MKTTRYFDEQVRRKRPYIYLTWCSDVITDPLRREVQPDGRVRYWAKSNSGANPRHAFSGS